MFQQAALSLAVGAILGSSSVTAIEPYEIQGNGFISPYNGQTLSGIHGVVTAKGPSGWWITGASDGDDKTSDGLYIYTTSATVRAQVNVGDEITLTGKVAEYRSGVSDLYSTEIGSPTNITKLSTGNTVTPIILGKDRSPPTIEYTSLDGGNVFGYPNNVTLISKSNITVQPDKYGLDFWSSLEGQLVTIKNPVALGFDTQYSDFWCHGDWPVTGKNHRGGLTMTADASGVVDANPEAIIIGSPLDGTSNPAVVTMGSTMEDITGVVIWAQSFYRVLPLTGAKVIAYPTEEPPATSFASVPIGSDGCESITFGDYNVENLTPTSSHLPNVTEHIANYLKSPDVLFLQEVQDNNGATDDGTVSSDLTLNTLKAGIVSAGGANYSWAVVDPVNDQDGGEPGGNIRVAFMYKPELFTVVNFTQGTSIEGTEVITVDGKPGLTFNPGRIDPTNIAFNVSRKPLVLQLQSVATGEHLFLINVHQSSKGGSTSIHGDPRPPVNGVIDARIAQAKVTANFVSKILAIDSAAKIIVSGDFNEFLFTKQVFAPFDGLLTDADVVAKIDPVERYTYQFDMSAQQLDHALVSAEVAKTLEYQHLHVNTWAPSYEARVSDHDPSVGRVKLCKTTTEPVCAYQVENWCAAPLPTFTDLPSCLKSVEVCVKQNADCIKTLGLSGVLKCAKYTAKCAAYTKYCLTNCTSKNSTSCSAFPS